MSDDNGHHGVPLDFTAKPFTESPAEDGAALLNEVEAFIRRYVIVSAAQSAAIALWVAHTYTFKVSAWTPYLDVSSATASCGKSLLLETLEFLVHKCWKVDGASPAVLFRKIELDRPTLLFDELDTIFKGDREAAQAVRQVLNSGAKYNGVVARCVGENHTPKDFHVFSPKALSGIGDLPPTVSSRSLPITLDRKLTAEKVEYLDHGDLAIKAEAAKLRQRLSDWIEKIKGELRNVTPVFPEGLTDRQKDGARTLLLVADAAGAQWPARARKVLCELWGQRTAATAEFGIQLLHDIRTVFDEADTDKLSSAGLVQKLAEIEVSPWPEWNRGKPMTPTSLSRLLKPFRIYPKTIRLGSETAKGYERDQFEQAWTRYTPRAVPTPPFETSQPSHSGIHAGLSHFSTPSQSVFVTDEKSEENPVSMRVVTAVTDEIEGYGRRQEKAASILPFAGQSGGPKPEGADAKARTLPSCPACGSFALYREKDGTTTCQTCQAAS